MSFGRLGLLDYVVIAAAVVALVLIAVQMFDRRTED